MKRFLPYLFLLCLGTSVPAPVRAQSHDIVALYKLVPNSYAILNFKGYLGKDLSYNWARCKKEFPAFTAKWVGSPTDGSIKGLGHDTTSFKQLTQFNAAFNDAGLRDDLVNGQSGAALFVDGGHWWSNYALIARMGIIQGAGSKDNYGNGGTEIELDKAGYLAFGGTEYNLMVSWNYGWKDAPFGYAGDWAHYLKVRDIKFTGSSGSGVNDPSYQSSALVVQRPGETFDVEDCYFRNWNDYGFVCSDGPAPCHMRGNSFFFIGKAAMYFKGTSVSVIELDGPSGDFYHQLIYAPDGGNFVITANKTEAYGPADVENTFKTQGFGEYLGTFGGFHQVVIDGGQIWGHGCIIDAAIVTFGTKTNGYNSYISWRGMSLQGVQNVVLDLDNGVRVPHGLALNGGPCAVTYTTGSGGYATDEHARPITLLRSTCPLQPWIGKSNVTGLPVGSFNYTTCSGGTPPPAPTPCIQWDCTAWSTCTGGVQTRTCSPLPAGCTGTPLSAKPPVSQACTVTPPPASRTFGPFTVTTAAGSVNQCVDLSAAPVRGVTMITVTMKPTAFTWGRIAGTGQGKPSLQVGTDGFMYFNGAKASTTKFTLNVKSTVVATIPPTDITAILQTDCAQGGAQRGDIESIKLTTSP